MPEPITIAQLIDASEDAQALSLFVNANAATQVPRRLANPVETLEYWRNYMSALTKGADGVDAAITSMTVTTGAAGTAASVVTGGTSTARTFALTIPRGDKGVDGSFTQKSYTTYALMDADKVNILANTSITITNDTDTTKNGMYAYNGTVFTKSAYDPLTQANTYTTTSVDNLESKLAKSNFTTGRIAPITTAGAAASSYAVSFVEAVNAGELTGVDFALAAADSIRFMVIRVSTGSSTVYNTIWNSVYYDLAVGKHSINLTTNSVGIKLQKGDLLGWQSTNKAIAFESVAASEPEKYYSLNNDGNGNVSRTLGALGSATPQIRFYYKSIPPLSAVILTQSDYEVLGTKDMQTIYMVV